MVAKIPGDKGAATQKLLKYKESTIRLLKRKLEIPATRLIQTFKLTEIEKEKEALETELINCKARLLKYEEKNKQWEKDAELWAEKENIFGAKQAELEREVQELKEKN